MDGIQVGIARQNPGEGFVGKPVDGGVRVGMFDKLEHHGGMNNVAHGGEFDDGNFHRVMV